MTRYGGSKKMHIGIASLFSLASIVIALPIAAQSTLRFTLDGWADHTWLLLEDRDATGDGRLSSVGILQRFHPKIDAEYGLDVISTGFSPIEEYDWYRTDNGVRWLGGSINRRELIDQTDVRLALDIGGTWSAHVKLNNEHAPTLDRNTLRVALRKSWLPGVYTFAEGSLHDIKPSSDITVGAGVARQGVRANAAFVVLDAFNGVVKHLLRTSRFSPTTTIEHERQPLAVRTTMSVNVTPRLRLELHAAALLPTTIRAFDSSVPDSGFRQHEAFGYVGVISEWQPTSSVTLGAFTTHVRAVMDRTPLSRGVVDDNFRLVERATEFGGVLLVRPSSRWLWQSRNVRSLRPEARDFRADTLTDVDWEDRAWSGQSSVTFLAPNGLRAGLAFEWDLRSVVRGNPDSTQLEMDAEGRLVGIGQVPSYEFLGRDQTRVRFELGWQFRPGRVVTLGIRMDVDGDDYAGPNSRFDGAHGRFVLTW